MPNLRERNAQHKIHIPLNARENQYLLAKFTLDDALLQRFNHLIDNSSEQPYQKFYQHLANVFFNVNESLGIESGQFIANDKFPRVRYSSERLTLETEQQLIFLYNPHYHRRENSYIKGDILANKITLLYLANGDDIRNSAAKFHRKVKLAIDVFSKELQLPSATVRICDHQHLAYDLFAKNKGVQGVQVHKLRTIATRYQQDDVVLPEDKDAMTYVIADLPLNRRLEKHLKSQDSVDFAAMYQQIFTLFCDSAKAQGFDSGTMLANDLVPIVRSNAIENKVEPKGELMMFSINPKQDSAKFSLINEENRRFDTLQFIIIATEKDKTSQGFGKFLNRVEDCMANLAKQLEFVPEKEEFMVRFHQHIGYYNR